MSILSFESTREERVTLTMAGADVEVSSLTGDEGLSKLFSFEIRAPWSHDRPAPKSLLGTAASVVLRNQFGASRVVRGLVTSASVCSPITRPRTRCSRSSFVRLRFGSRSDATVVSSTTRRPSTS